MKNLILSSSAFFMLLVLIAPAPLSAHALTVFSATGETEASGETSLLSTNLGLDVSVSASANTRANTGTSTSVRQNEEMQANTNTRSQNGMSASFLVNALGIAVTSSSQVESDTDLEIFAENIRVEKNGAARVEVSSNNDESRVEVIYTHRGKFLGLIPINLRSTTEVIARADSEAEVRSNLPWWSFLVANKNYSKADIESRIKNNTAIQANATMDASAHTKARLAEAVLAEIEAHASAQSSIGN